MVQIDHRIPLQVQQPNILAALDAGTQAATAQNTLMRQMEGANIFRQYGAGALTGDKNALAAIAGYDPTISQGIQANSLNMDATRLDMELTSERIADVRRQAAEAARAQKDAKAAAAELEQAKYFMRGLGQAFLNGDEETWSVITEELGLSGIPMNEGGLRLADATISGFEEGLSGIAPQQEGFRSATPEEAGQYGAAAGQFGPDGRFYPINPPRGISMEVGPDGTMRFAEGAGVGSPGMAEGNPQIGEVYNPGEVMGTVALIDEIYTDPSIPRITGTIQGGGGNDPEGLNMAQRVMAGEQGMGAIAKINQVQSRGWLAARQMLKGGGPITDYESRKAEAAVARLTRAQGEAEFKAALQDFREAITDGMMKLERAGRLPPGTTAQLPPSPYTQPTGSGSAGIAPSLRSSGLPVDSVNAPPAAIDMLRGDPSPEAMAEFDEMFGAGAAARALGQ